MAPVMSPTCKSWDLMVMRGLEQTSLANTIFLFIAKVKACWKVILTRYLKNWMQKDKDKWPLDRLSWKKQAHSFIKWSISRSSVLCIFTAIKVKWCFSWSLLYLWILTMALSFTIALVDRLMTFETIASRIRSVTTTSTMKTWSSWVM